MVYEYGMDPDSGVIERSGLHDGTKFDQREYFFSELPHDKVSELAMVLRDTEDALVEILLEANPKEIYRERIFEFAQRGALAEKQFYELVGVPYPGDNAINAGETSRIRETYGERLRPEDPAIVAARDFKIAGKTTVERMDAASLLFAGALKKRMHLALRATSCQDLLVARGKD